MYPDARNAQWGDRQHRSHGALIRWATFGITAVDPDHVIARCEGEEDYVNLFLARG